jgi:hypothetical protein
MQATDWPPTWGSVVEHSRTYRSVTGVTGHPRPHEIRLCPQAYLNFVRESTSGYALGWMVFEFVGGIFSVLQMLLLGFNHEDVGSVVGNPGKLGSGVVVIFFNGLFLFQRFILYSKNGHTCKNMIRRSSYEEI